jgi:hypothetical protein
VEPFKTEADMIREWLTGDFKATNHRGQWLVYPETAGWDLLLAHEDGYQIGIEAKLSLNAKVIDQALSGAHGWRAEGPDYRAVLVPADKVQLHLGNIATAIGIHILTVERKEQGAFRGTRYIPFPDEASNYCRWPNWMPEVRCTLPEYVPDVEGGHSAPVQLTPWKIKAIRLMIILERRGYVTRADMKALQISSTRWCDHWHGFLDVAPSRRGGYVRGKQTPDLKAQHPTNYAEIEADFDKWFAPLALSIKPDEGSLL